MTEEVNGKDFPVASKRDLTEQFSFLKKQNLKHADFANKTFQELFGEEVLKKLSVKSINYSSSIIAVNEGGGHFEIERLPSEVQYSSFNASAIIDVNGDGKEDVLIGGNDYGFLPQFSRLDASYGGLLVNKGDGEFRYVPCHEVGCETKGEVRDIKVIDDQVLMGINGDSLKVLNIFSREIEI